MSKTTNAKTVGWVELFGEEGAAGLPNRLHLKKAGSW